MIECVFEGYFSEISLFGLHSIMVSRDLMTMGECGSRIETTGEALFHRTNTAQTHSKAITFVLEKQAQRGIGKKLG